MEYWNDLLHSAECSANLIVQKHCQANTVECVIPAHGVNPLAATMPPLPCPSPYPSFSSPSCASILDPDIMCMSSLHSKGKGKARAGLVADNGFLPCTGMTHVTVLFWQCFCTLYGSAAFRVLEDHSSSPVFHSSTSSPVFQSNIGLPV